MVGLRLAKNRVSDMAFLRALIFSLVLAGCLAGPAYAGKNDPNPLKLDEDQRRKDDVAIDKQYKSTIERTNRNPVEIRATDPWQNMRGTDDSKAKR